VTNKIFITLGKTLPAVLRSNIAVLILDIFLLILLPLLMFIYHWCYPPPKQEVSASPPSIGDAHELEMQNVSSTPHNQPAAYPAAAGGYAGAPGGYAPVPAPGTGGPQYLSPQGSYMPGSYAPVPQQQQQQQQQQQLHTPQQQHFTSPAAPVQGVVIGHVVASSPPPVAPGFLSAASAPPPQPQQLQQQQKRSDGRKGEGDY